QASLVCAPALGVDLLQDGGANLLLEHGIGAVELPGLPQRAQLPRGFARRAARLRLLQVEGEGRIPVAAERSLLALEVGDRLRPAPRRRQALPHPADRLDVLRIVLRGDPQGAGADRKSTRLNSIHVQ